MSYAAPIILKMQGCVMACDKKGEHIRRTLPVETVAHARTVGQRQKIKHIFFTPFCFKRFVIFERFFRKTLRLLGF